MRTITIYDKGEMILEGKIKENKVKKIMDIVFESPYTAVIGKAEEDEM